MKFNMKLGRNARDTLTVLPDTFDKAKSFWVAHTVQVEPRMCGRWWKKWSSEISQNRWKCWKSVEPRIFR